MSRDRDPEVTHSEDNLTGMGTYTIHTTHIKDGDKTYCGTGYSREEADQRAGENYSRGNDCDHPKHK